MKLSALATETGVSTASIKYYIHTGILPAGQKKNATTAVYDDSHVHRLALISWLRTQLGISLDSIAILTRAIDDESVPVIDLMGTCQEIALASNGVIPPPDMPGDSNEQRVESAGSERPPQRDFEDDVRQALGALSLPDTSDAARRAVAAGLAALSESGYPVGTQTVVQHARALAEIAKQNTAPINNELSRDEVCLQVICGITLHNRLLLAVSALVHASLSGLARQSQE